MSFVKEFKKGVYDQAISKGYAPSQARAIAAKAVISRLHKEEGAVVAESDEFEPVEYVDLVFDDNNYSVDESAGSGVIVTASLMNDSLPNSQGKKWTSKAIRQINDYINTNGLAVFAPDEHSEWRKSGTRENSESIAEWVTSKVVDGSLIVQTKLKQGWEWVADKFSQVSIEAKVPLSKTRTENGVELIDEALPVGFIFTNKSKNPLNRVISVVKEIFTK